MESAIDQNPMITMEALASTNREEIGMKTKESPKPIVDPIIIAKAKINKIRIFTSMGG